MAISLLPDRIMEPEDALELFGVSDQKKLYMLLNSLSKQFLRFTGRRRILSGSATEYLKGNGSDQLWLHASPVDTGSEVTLMITRAEDVIGTYTLTGGDLSVITDDYSSSVELTAASLPGPTDPGAIKIEYTGGFTTVPGDVLQGAMLQGRVELRRMDGEVGVTSKSYEGESVRFESNGIVSAVSELWAPYMVLA